MATGASIRSGTIGAPASPRSSPIGIPSGSDSVAPASLIRRAGARYAGCGTGAPSRHHKEFLDPGAGPRLLADHARWMRRRLANSGVPEAAIEAPFSVIGNPPAMEAGLAWYRARGERQPLGPIAVPTLYIWGDADDTVGRERPRGPESSSPRPTASRLFPALTTMQRIRCRRSSLRCCSSISPAIGSDGGRSFGPF